MADESSRRRRRWILPVLLFGAGGGWVAYRRFATTAPAPDPGDGVAATASGAPPADDLLPAGPAAETVTPLRATASAPVTTPVTAPTDDSDTEQTAAAEKAAAEKAAAEKAAAEKAAAEKAAAEKRAAAEAAAAEEAATERAAAEKAAVEQAAVAQATAEQKATAKAGADRAASRGTGAGEPAQGAEQSQVRTLVGQGDAAAEEPYGPGSAAPLADGSAPGPEYTIKGNADSMLFHTPASPYYRRTKAEAWFRTAEDATRAGFTEWKPKRRKS